MVKKGLRVNLLEKQGNLYIWIFLRILSLFILSQVAAVDVYIWQGTHIIITYDKCFVCNGSSFGCISGCFKLLILKLNSVCNACDFTNFSMERNLGLYMISSARGSKIWLREVLTPVKLKSFLFWLKNCF